VLTVADPAREGRYMVVVSLLTLPNPKTGAALLST